MLQAACSQLLGQPCAFTASHARHELHVQPPASMCGAPPLQGACLILHALRSFAPVIYEAMRVVAESGMQFHILLLLADGQARTCVSVAAGSHVLLYPFVLPVALEPAQLQAVCV